MTSRRDMAKSRRLQGTTAETPADAFSLSGEGSLTPGEPQGFSDFPRRSLGVPPTLEQHREHIVLCSGGTLSATGAKGLSDAEIIFVSRCDALCVVMAKWKLNLHPLVDIYWNAILECWGAVTMTGDGR